MWRKPVEAILTWLAVTAAFALFGVMLGVSATLVSAVAVLGGIAPAVRAARLPVAVALRRA